MIFPLLLVMSRNPLTSQGLARLLILSELHVQVCEPALRRSEFQMKLFDWRAEIELSPIGSYIQVPAGKKRAKVVGPRFLVLRNGFDFG